MVSSPAATVKGNGKKIDSAINFAYNIVDKMFRTVVFAVPSCDDHFAFKALILLSNTDRDRVRNVKGFLFRRGDVYR